MLLSNSKIDYSTLRRMPTVKFAAQTQATTGATMPTSTSLQDISKHHKQKFTWSTPIQDETDRDQRFIYLSKDVVSSKAPKRLSVSHSDDRIFEHPEVTIKPSILDQEIQKRLSILKTSSTPDEIFDSDQEITIPNILEHPDMSSPVIMLTQQNSSSSSALLFSQDQKRMVRQHSADVFITVTRTPSPNTRLELIIDQESNAKQSITSRPTVDEISNENHNEIRLSSTDCQTNSFTSDRSAERVEDS